MVAACERCIPITTLTSWVFLLLHVYDYVQVTSFNFVYALIGVHNGGRPLGDRYVYTRVNSPERYRRNSVQKRERDQHVNASSN